MVQVQHRALGLPGSRVNAVPQCVSASDGRYGHCLTQVGVESVKKGRRESLVPLLPALGSFF